MSFLDKLFDSNKGFSLPDGINFKSPPIDLASLTECLDSFLNYIKNDYNDKYFWLYDDWWEFDGTHFPRKKVSLADLEDILSNSKELFNNKRQDFLVYTGIAPVSYHWYLRYNIESDDSSELNCSFDVTIPFIDAERFKEQVLNTDDINIHQSDARDYYKSIIKAAQNT